MANAGTVSIASKTAKRRTFTINSRARSRTCVGELYPRSSVRWSCVRGGCKLATYGDLYRAAARGEYWAERAQDGAAARAVRADRDEECPHVRAERECGVRGGG